MALQERIKELQERYRSDIVGSWTTDYGGWSPSSEDLAVLSDGSGTVSGMSDMTFRWERNGDYSMKVWEIAYPGGEDPAPDPTVHVVTWRFEAVTMHDGESVVQLKLSPFGLLVVRSPIC